MTRCPGDEAQGCVNDGPCLTHGLWHALGRHIYVFLSGISLADVVAGRALGAGRHPEVELGELVE